MSDQAISRRLTSGTWERIHERVYRFAGTTPAWRGLLLAACWAGGPRGAASHRSAARLWSFPGGREGHVELVCPRWRRSRHAHLIVHETTVIDSWDLRLVDGIPVTSPERTLLDLGAVCRASTVELAVNTGLHRGLVTRAALHAMLGRLGRQGRNGAGVLRQILDPHDPGHTTPESPAESRLLQVLRRNGLPEPVPQFEVYSGGVFIARVDAAYPGWRIAIEYESIQHHTGSEALLRDSARRNRLIAIRWKPITATLADLRNGGIELCRAIRAAI